jgi:hypothetical protein
MVSMDNICFPPLENESSLQKANSMRLHVVRLCRGGRWYLYLAVPQRPRSRFNGLSPGSRVTRRLSCSSTMTRQAVRQRRKQQASYNLARQRSQDLRSYKDASDALQANDSEAIRRAIWDAKPYRPDGIVDGKTLLELVTTPTQLSDHDYPFSGLQSESCTGFDLANLSPLLQASGIGKSSFCRELATNLLSAGERVGYLALEESTVEQLWD